MVQPKALRALEIPNTFGKFCGNLCLPYIISAPAYNVIISGLCIQVQRTLPPCDRRPPGDEWRQQLREFLTIVQNRMSATRDTETIQTINSLIQQLIDRYMKNDGHMNELKCNNKDVWPTNAK